MQNSFMVLHTWFVFTRGSIQQLRMFVFRSLSDTTLLLSWCNPRVVLSDTYPDKQAAFGHAHRRYGKVAQTGVGQGGPQE